MSCNILIWKQWDSNLVSHVTENHIHVHVHAVIIVYKETPLKRYTCMYMYIIQSTTVNYYTNYYKGCGASEIPAFYQLLISPPDCHEPRRKTV